MIQHSRLPWLKNSGERLVRDGNVGFGATRRTGKGRGRPTVAGDGGVQFMSAHTLRPAGIEAPDDRCMAQGLSISYPRYDCFIL